MISYHEFCSEIKGLKHFEYYMNELENNTFPIKEGPCPRVAHQQPWSQIAKSPYTNNTLPIWIQSRSFYQHGLTLIQAWISNHMPSNVLVEITYPFQNFYDAAVEVLSMLGKIWVEITVQPLNFENG